MHIQMSFSQIKLRYNLLTGCSLMPDVLLFNLSGLLWALLVLVVTFLFLDHSCEKDATRGLIYRKVVQSSVTSPDMYMYLWISLVVSFLHIKRWFSGLCIYERERELNCDLHGGLWAVKASREEGREHCLGWKRPCRAKGQCTESKQGTSARLPQLLSSSELVWTCLILIMSPNHLKVVIFILQTIITMFL